MKTPDYWKARREMIKSCAPFDLGTAFDAGYEAGKAVEKMSGAPDKTNSFFTTFQKGVMAVLICLVLSLLMMFIGTKLLQLLH